MTAPSFLTVADSRWAHRQIIRFGGLPRADTGATQSYIDLNDGNQWFAQGIEIDGSHISNKASQLNWRGKGVWTAQDFIGRKILIPNIFDEGNSGGVSYPAAKGVMTMAGEQYLTFDGITGMRVRLNGFSTAKPLTPHAPYLWDAPLEFLSRNPFAEDLGGAITDGPHAMGSVPGGFGFTGALAQFTINYTGAAYGEPVVVISVPNLGSATIANTSVNNSSFPGMFVSCAMGVGGGPHTLTFDSTLFVVLQDVTQFAPSGTFPFLFPGANVMQVAVASSVDLGGVGLTCTVAYANKWEI